ncbi:hypothetical protein FRC01_003859, partial [Tulasnella sp. 417]
KKLEERLMEVDTTQSDITPDQVTAPDRKNPLPPISHLPTELLAEIIQVSLNEIDFKSSSASYDLRLRVGRLYIMRSVAKLWQAILEETPSFWTIIASELPHHVNETSILLSLNLPLSVIYSFNSEAIHRTSRLSGTEFLKPIQHTRPRWKTLVMDPYDPTTMSDYLETPSPLLQTLVARTTDAIMIESEPQEVLGGDTSNLRFVGLSGVSIRWRTGCFVGLKYLDLKDVTHDGLTVPNLLDTLHASPDLQVLKLAGMIGTNIPQISSTITLRHLNYIELDFCNIGLVECIVKQIRAPSCTKLSLSIGEEAESDFPHLLNEKIQPLHSILRKILKLCGESEVILTTRGLAWHTLDYSGMKGFSISFYKVFDPCFIDWVERILPDDSSLGIEFGSGGASIRTLLGSVPPMRRVTRATIGEHTRAADVAVILRFLGQPITSNASLPSLPCLQEFRVPPGICNTSDLLEMVQSRFDALSWEPMERTPLTIIVQSGGIAFERNPSRSPRRIFVFDTVVKIRDTSGVKRFQLVDWKEPEGMLAVVYSEIRSNPGWL